ncbi:MAG: TRC40/GET3/ArsA family transport-energizing ATPase [Thermodesulfobacteriota bacterium]|nr:TRC40/GET3/ArsA family transport-energizing ATPase [Thermodesulfobacteriota bacterium]
MRIILFTGKGGVGKTTVSAATAVRCANLGYKTLIISTDSAHSLADSFDMEIGNQPTYITDNLYGEEIDINYEIKKNWGPIQSFMQDFLKYRGFGSIIAEELSVFPGMEEVFSLLQLKDFYMEESYDVIIIDCAPTGDAFRLLAVPDIAKWYMERIFNVERILFKAVRPVAKRLVDMPLPSDNVFESMEGLYKNLIGMKELLTDIEISSIRLVINPEKMVIKESQRAFTFLNLFGFSVDAIIANRIIPQDVKDPFYSKWKDIQKKHLTEANESFRPLPLFSLGLLDQEITGIELLSKIGNTLYDRKDPTEVFYSEKPIDITESNGSYYLCIRLPFATKENIDMWKKGEELIIKVNNYKRNIHLPRFLTSLKMGDVKMIDEKLTIRFGGEGDGS